MDSETFDDLIQSVEVALGKDLREKTVACMFSTVSLRISELEAPASEESKFDEASLELGLLKALLGQISLLPGTTHPTNLHVH